MGGREDTKHWIFVFFIFPGDLSHTITSSHLVQKKKSIGADQHYLTPACSQWSAFLIFSKWNVGNGKYPRKKVHTSNPQAFPTGPAPSWEHMSRLPCDDFNSPLMSSAHMPLLSGFSVRPHWAHAAGAGFRERSQEAHGGSFLRLCLGRFSVHIHDISARSRDQNHNEGYPPNWTSRSSFPGWESSEI